MKGRDLFKVGAVNELEATDLKSHEGGISRIYTFPNSAGIDHTLIFTILQTRHIDVDLAQLFRALFHGDRD